MDIGYTDEQQAMRTELRSYYQKLLDEKTVKDLLENNWQIRDRFFDENYHTKVFILTR